MNEILIGLSNAFELINSRFLVVPYGDHEHPQGIQRFTPDAGRALANNFSSLRGRMARRFGGLPFFIGHPDDPAFSNEHKDTKSYGWIMDLAARDDGLYMDVKWSDPGTELLSNGHYKYFSPRWGAKIVGTEGGRNVLEPTVLISCGLTNRPQIPVLPLANEQAEQERSAANKKEDEVMEKWLKELFGLKADAAEADLKTAVSNAKKAADEIEQAKTALSNEKTARDSAEQLGKDALATLANEKKAREDAEKALADERKARIELVVANAIAAGKIMPADKDKWTEDLGKEFEPKMKELSNAKPVMKIASETDGLGARSNQARSVQSTILTLVNERMEKTKVSYDVAFQQVKKENPDLFGKK